ncbi:diaminopimelate decarboxylase [Clostridium algidicarnis]|uniref:diaminopimelate decarboxylase n=1 Tax=Clostridium algidicarnis TaxID=37659 RepID=UPI003FD88834
MVKKKIPFTHKEIENIIKSYSTPFHIYDEKEMVDNTKRLKEAFSWCEGFKEYFAVKATPNPCILKILKNQGFGADCSSLPELVMAERCGIVGENIMFTSNNTPTEEYRKALEMGAIINIDDISHIKILDKIGMPDLICLRYNPGKLRSGNDFIGKPEEAKFGMTKEQLIESYNILKEKGVKRFGIHTMIATQVLDPSYFINTAQMLFDLVLEISLKCDISFEFINIGGGIGIPYDPNEEAIDINFIGSGIRKLYEKFLLKNENKPLKIYMEFGRMITGPYGYLVSKVIHTKNIYKKYIGIDACMANLMRVGMYGLYHHITISGKEHMPLEEIYDITGSLCENNDKFAIDRKLPKIEIGDIVVIHDTGAHGHAMGFNYNGKLRSAELLLRADGTVLQIRRAETIEDYFSTLNYDILNIL